MKVLSGSTNFSDVKYLFNEVHVIDRNILYEQFLLSGNCKYSTMQNWMWAIPSRYVCMQAVLVKSMEETCIVTKGKNLLCMHFFLFHQLAWSEHYQLLCFPYNAFFYSSIRNVTVRFRCIAFRENNFCCIALHSLQVWWKFVAWLSTISYATLIILCVENSQWRSFMTCGPATFIVKQDYSLNRN